MERYKDVKTFYAKDRKAWRKWLAKNHQVERSVWLIIYKKQCATPSVYYPEAVDEALCFGWIDSKPNKRDANSYYQFFSQRNPKSRWSKVNKKKVAALIEQGLMQDAGYRLIEIAKNNGSWTSLEQVDNVELPADLKQHFAKNKTALANWENFPRSSKRGILEWILSARKPETRLRRIRQTVELAADNIKANHYRQ